MTGWRERGFPVLVMWLILLGVPAAVALSMIIASSPTTAERVADCEQIGGTVIYDYAMRFDGCQVDGER